MKNSRVNMKKAQYIIKNKDKLIRSKKRKRALRKRFLLLILISGSIATALFKLPYFNVNNIVVQGNDTVTTDKILELSQLKLGKNIFYMKTSNIEDNILSNPYISEAKVKRKLPKRINITIKEKVAVFYYKNNDDYYIIDENGCILEKKESIKNLKLVRLDNINGKNFEVGKVIPMKDQRELKVIKEISELIYLSNKKNGINNITSVSLGNLIDIKIYCKNFYIKIGTSEDLKSKFQKGINIISQADFKDKKGYVDVSFKSNPVVRVE